MFSKFKQVPGTQEVVLKDLTEDQLSEVAGGKSHHHHHHHHPVWKKPTGTTGMTGTTTGMTGTTGTTTGTTMGMAGTTTVGGVTYPNNAHW